MITLIKNAEVYAPKYLGRRDVLLTADKICKISEVVELSGSVEYTEIDATGKILFPGFIDSHVHIAGGGGEGGFNTRTPEIMISDITQGGVTTVIGCLGTDGTTRSMANLLAKAKALEEEGITTFVNTGSYQVPVLTLTGSITDDIVFIDKIIGVGEIAISDHRCSQPSFEEITRIISEARIGGMLSKKAGTVNFHVGDSPRMIDILEQIVENTEIPIKNIIPTHMNRNEFLFEKGIEYAKTGGIIDLTTSSIPRFFEEGEVKCSSALKILIEEGVPVENVTMSSDGQGSLPEFDEQGRVVGISVGKVTSLYKEIQDAILVDKVPVEYAVMTVTSNPAAIYRLRGKGSIIEGFDADIVLVNADTFDIETVISKGRIMVMDKAVTVRGTFE
ncbi:beta-aspartyl-peptidase [Proteocatella sphenisci]|uniref:beta-aspartyl-peptidase n=1 Tax=Proteocatella sphenisci TaxID=181070 RepID=UPI00048BE6A1|nr:beta-aspartyl-peptidase [Proteocatella sphenisci]